MQKILLFFGLLFFCCDVVSAVMPHKTFVIRSYMGMDILCGPYTVQKHDFVLDILKRKGMLSEGDFPRFVTMLKQLNPHVSNLNRIYPGQHIIVPLKYVKSTGTTSPGSLTIPVIPDILYYDYTIKADDSISRILAEHYDVPLVEIKTSDLQVFRRINPDIKDINTIYPGQSIHIPILDLSNDPSWKETAQTPPKEAEESESPARDTPVLRAVKEPRKEEERPLPIMDKGTKWSRVVLSETLKPLGGDLVSSGHYYLPGKGGTEHRLDLAAFPVLEFSDRRIVFDPEERLSDPMNDILSQSWKDIEVIRGEGEITTQSMLEKVIDALGGTGVKGKSIGLSNGVSAILRGDWVFSRKQTQTNKVVYVCVTVIKRPKERTPYRIQQYLAANGIYVIDILAEKPDKRKIALRGRTRIESPFVANAASPDKKTFVADFMDRLGIPYVPDTVLAFSYAGFDLEVRANIGTCPDGAKLIIDFISAFSDISPVMARQGIKVVTVNPKDTIPAIGKNILEILGIPFVKSPLFLSADRGGLRTVGIRIPGILISPPGRRDIMLTHLCCDNDIPAFLKNRSIDLLMACDQKNAITSKPSLP